ncbi:MAG: hypothetical protein CH6_2419 [Candidatus Kapaibacterium sp.]|nr:MAG: hypothetical protein CH6_2419 [Candidatus Kapabacteria bacterium]
MEFSKTQKLLLSIFIIGIMIWIGGSIIRSAIVYDIFEADYQQLKFRYWVDEKIALITVRNFAVGSLYTGIGFFLSLLSSIFLFPAMKKHFKSEGWLFMSFILLVIAYVFEIILLYFDIRLGLYLFFNPKVSYYSNEVQTFFYERFSKYNFLMVYNWFAVISIILFSVFKPLRKK